MNETKKRVLFLCTGNYYRSRFAEIFFNWHAEQRSLSWRAESRGLALVKENVGPLSSHTVARLAALGIPVEAHLRLPLAAANADFEFADHIVAVKEAEHRPLIESRFPVWLERVEFWGVHDVDCAHASEAMPVLESEVLGLLARLGEAGGSGPMKANPPCRVLLDAPRSGTWNMAIDEVLSEQAAREERAHLRIYAWAEPTVSIGYFQGVDERESHRASHGCPLVRRPSGGGAIVHDQEVTYALAVPGPWRAREQRELYRRVHQGLVALLRELDAAAALCPPRPAEDKADPFLCFLRKTEGDVLIGDHKVVGSAQRRGKGAVVQHGSILLKRSPAAPELPGIEDLSSARLAPEEWVSRVRDCVLDALDFIPRHEPLSDAEHTAAQRLVDEKYGRAQWLARR